MELYSSMPTAITPLFVGDGKVCNIVKTAINCQGGSTTQNNCVTQSGNICITVQSSC